MENELVDTGAEREDGTSIHTTMCTRESQWEVAVQQRDHLGALR